LKVISEWESERGGEGGCSSTKAENEMESRFLLDVVIGKSSSIFELFTSEDETLGF